MWQTSLSRRGDLSDQRQARTGVKGPGQSSNELLGVAQVFLVPSVEILQDKAAEGVGTLSEAYALLIPQQLRCCGLWAALYCTYPGFYAGRATQWLPSLCPRRSGWRTRLRTGSQLVSGQRARNGPTRVMRNWATCGDWLGGLCDRGGWLR